MAKEFPDQYCGFERDLREKREEPPVFISGDRTCVRCQKTIKYGERWVTIDGKGYFHVQCVRIEDARIG